jgi:3-hydroxyisobutyrate dehydrogenase
VAKAADPKGVYVMDAGMLGMPPIARAGNERFLIGGPDELVERVTSHLLQIGKEVVHAGPLGTANLVKLANNLLVGCQPLVLHEAAQIAQAGGVPYRHALNVMRQLHTGAMIEHWEGSFDAAGDDIIPRLGNNVFGKDLPLLADLAKSYGVDAPVTQLLASEGLRLLRPRREGE